MIVECLDDVIVQFAGRGHDALRIGIERPLAVVLHVDQGDLVDHLISRGR